MRGIDFQRLFLLKILKHPIWKGVVLNYVEMEHAFNAIGNIAKGWQQIKGCHSKDDQQAKNVIIPMILSESTSSICKTSFLIGIHHQNFTLGVVRRMSLELQTIMHCRHFVGSQRGKMHYLQRCMMLWCNFGLKTTKLVQTKEMSSRTRLALESGKHMQPIFLQNPK